REIVLDKQGKIDKGAIYKQYGSTLLGVMITRTFLFAFQLGDGDIMYVDVDGVKSVIEGDKILGTETHSLSKQDSWKSAITVVLNKDEGEKVPYMYMLSSDGMSNSFTSQDEFYKTCRDYYDLIKAHGCKTIARYIKEWLSETSALGCGDDITVMIGYYEEAL
ncbi:protein phosphatase 2C domain-containing protein, partial [Lachnotalea glycerini]